jgi:hypothetical protein
MWSVEGIGEITTCPLFPADMQKLYCRAVTCGRRLFFSVGSNPADLY